MADSGSREGDEEGGLMRNMEAKKKKVDEKETKRFSSGSKPVLLIQDSKRTHTIASLRERVRCYRKFRLVEIHSHSHLSLSNALVKS